jgi:hypothetical protein
MAPAKARPGASLDRLRPGDRLFIRPSIPRQAERHEHRVERIEDGAAVIDAPHFDRPVRIPASEVAHLNTPDDGGPAVLVLKGRLQWITADREWVVREEELSPENEFGLDKTASPEDAHVVTLVSRLQQAGCSPWWVPHVSVQEFLEQGGEVVYDQDGRYLRTRQQGGEWILLSRRGAGAAPPA